MTDDLSCTEVVREARQRCDQENLIAQLKGGVRALHAPVNTLHANWAYMVMAALAWSLKAWVALWLPIAPRWRQRHAEEQRRLLRMDFRTFPRRVHQCALPGPHAGATRHLPAARLDPLAVHLFPLR